MNRRIVLDTNSLVQVVSRHSPYHGIWRSVLAGKSILCITNEILDEYEEVLERNTSALFASLVIDVILNCRYTLFVNPTFRFGLITEDPDDNKFVDCAIAAGAKFIVTEDRHFNVLRDVDFPHVEVIGLDAFSSSIQEFSPMC